MYECQWKDDCIIYNHTIQQLDKVELVKDSGNEKMRSQYTSEKEPQDFGQVL